MGGQYTYEDYMMEKDRFGNYIQIRPIEINWAKVECTGTDNSHPKTTYRLRVGQTKTCKYCGRTWTRIPDFT